jgi:vancomycin resistance protein VanJ
MNRTRRFLETLFIFYAIFLILYLILRFLLQVEWSWLLLLHNGAPYLFLLGIIFFIIAFLIQAPRIAGIYLLLLVVALVWFAPVLMPKSTNNEAEDSFRVLNFNVYPDNKQIDNAAEWLLEQSADILLLQELPQALPALEAAYPYHEYNPDQTYALFSRYPIELGSEFDLLGEAQQRFILNVDGQNIALYNIHLLMPLNEREREFLLFRYDESRRNQQIAELLTAVEAETIPVLVAGDFNMSEWSPIYSSLSARLQDAYRVSSWGLGATWPGGASEELPDFLPRLARLDYLWYSRGFEAISAYVGSALGSDHLPLVVEMRLAGDRNAD